MSKEFCNPAKYEKIGAIYVGGMLLIWATGKTVNQYYSVSIRQSPFRIYPPMYDLLVCSSGVVPDIYNATPYRVWATFQRSEPKEGHVTVNTAEGRTQVPVFVLGEVPFDPFNGKRTMLTAPQSSEGSNRKSDSVPGAFSLPLNLKNVFESGKSETVELPKADEQIEVVEGTGYSDALSFDEAFMNAVQNLPPSTHNIIDWLTLVNVTSIGGEFGGIAGLRRLRVSVSTVRPR